MIKPTLQIEDSLFKRLHQHAQKRLIFDPGVPRHKQLPAYKRYMQLENEMLKRHHRKGDSGLVICQSRAAMIDVIIENLFLAALDLYTTEEGPLPCKMAVLATGGYGRRELNPHSDIDIMFLYPMGTSGKTFIKFQEVLAEEILYPLWDLGLKVGHASRNAKEVIEESKKEVQSKNAILESRLICGSAPLFKSMRKRFSEFCKKESSTVYIQQRLEDERQRHIKAGSTIYLQEPDVKNGVGGLRDYQNILWMANIKFGHRSFRDLVKAKLLRDDEREAVCQAYDFLLRTRTELHLQSRRPTDKLDLERQARIAEKLNYPGDNDFTRVEKFMRDYYTAARTIFNTSELLKERMAIVSTSDNNAKITFRNAFLAYRKTSIKQIEGFQIYQKTLSIGRKDTFEQDPVRIIRVFRIAQQFGAKIDSDLRYLITRSIPLIDHELINSRQAARAFLSILRSPGEVYPILSLMHSLGVLGRYLPEFGELTCMVQHEYYHRYTADEHVLQTIRHLDKVFQKADPTYIQYEAELRKNQDPILLYLILLLHDIGKAEGVKGHDVTGVRLAKPVLDRFDIELNQQEQVLFIIRNHLEMARFWQKFDLDDPQTASSFAQFILNQEQLRFLYVHTFCDARGTAPTLWNDYKDSMHRTLYVRTLEQFKNDQIIEKNRKKQTEMLHQDIKDLAIEGIPSDEIDAHFKFLPERYFVNTERSHIELHLKMVHELVTQISESESTDSLAPIVDWRNDVDLGMTVVNVVTWDRAGLFYKLAGALTLAGVSIVSTKAITRKDHISIDTFYIIDPSGGVVTDTEAQTTFRTWLDRALIEGKELLPAIEKREEEEAKQQAPKDMLPAPFPPKIDVYHELSLKQTIIEVHASDRIGLLYRLSRLIAKKGFDIGFARIATERGVAMDTFYLQNAENENDESAPALLTLREELEAIVQE